MRLHGVRAHCGKADVEASERGEESGAQGSLASTNSGLLQ